MEIIIKDHSVSDIEAIAVLRQQQSEGVEDSNFESKYLQLVWIPLYITLRFLRLIRSEPKVIWLQTLSTFFSSGKITVTLMVWYLLPFFCYFILSFFSFSHSFDLSCSFPLYFLLFLPFLSFFFLFSSPLLSHPLILFLFSLLFFGVENR